MDANRVQAESPSPAEYYEQRCEHFAGNIAALESVDRRMLYVRTGTFFLTLLILGYSLPNAFAVGYFLGTATFVAFVAAIGYHERLLRELFQCREALKLNKQMLARLERKWDGVSLTSVSVPAEHSATAHDLDLFGHGSLFHLVCSAHTPKGIELLRDWLLEPALPDEVARRQQSVEELAPRRLEREQLMLRGSLVAAGLASPTTFVDWAEEKSWLGGRPILKWCSRIAPLAGAVSIGLMLVGLMPGTACGAVVALAGIVNLAVTVIWGGHIHDTFDRITTRENALGHYRALFDLMSHMPHESELLAAIDRDVVHSEHGAARELRHLARIMRLANIRHDSFFGVIYIFLQLLFLWDFHILVLVERWQRQVGHSVGRWFEALAQFEALASFASLAADSPDWTFPQVESSNTCLDAEAIGHPLLPAGGRVANDVSVGPAGTVLLVTGSNMSGKSTLLRSLGVNAVLAAAGSRVCAQRFSLPPLVVITSMRTEDSLDDGVSFYMAELKRLKQIVDQAAHYEADPNRTLLYLLDEILQGTNSVERHIAVGRVVKHLLAKNAIGAVSTHDLELAKTETLDKACQTVHFRESFEEKDGKRTMSFDYLLRPGIATTTNALVLLDMVGLSEQ